MMPRQSTRLQNYSVRNLTIDLGVKVPAPTGDWGADSRIAGFIGFREGKYGKALRLDGARLGLLDLDTMAGTLELR
ncbi:hypothetical protein Mapa_000004 [Marchantia paleacea]|nr:hypothetical protein Mapa_000004 [Marchantia paleacea]